jgi:hypothetical protein
MLLDEPIPALDPEPVPVPDPVAEPVLEPVLDPVPVALPEPCDDPLALGESVPRISTWLFTYLRRSC